MSAPKTKSAPKSTRGAKTWRAPRPRSIDLLDPARLTETFRNPTTGLVDYHEPGRFQTWLAGAAPPNFKVALILDRDGSSYLWIGITDRAPNRRVCFACISEEQLRAFAAEVLRYFPPQKGGAR